MQALNTGKKKSHRLISGALFDFMAFITSSEDFEVGKHSDVVPLLDRFKKWAAQNNLDVDQPDPNWEIKI